MLKPTHGLAALAALCLGGCVSLPFDRLSLNPFQSISLAKVEAPAMVADAWPDETWWATFDDAQLDGLMQRALAGNPNLAAAQSRLEQAQAAAGIARGNAAPQINADLSGNRGRQSANYIIPKPPFGPGGEIITQGAANINLGFDLDLWGRNAALIKAAEAQAEAARYDHAAARLALTSAIARAYAQLAAQHELLEIADATLKQRNAIADLTRQRLAAGLDTNLEVRQAETNTAALEAERVQLETAISLSRLQLAALVGDMPDAAAAIGRPRLKAGAMNVPAGLTLDLLGRRPEIAAQRARIAAAREEVVAARAQFYPNINLTALIGYQAIGLNNLFTSASLMNAVGPAIHLPIFDGGRIKSNFLLRTHEMEGSIAQYNQSVLAAAQDVAEQLTRAAALDREATATAAALAAAEDAYRIAMLRYREGLTSFLSVLSVEGQLLAQRRAQADLDARRIDTRIQLIRALGGGFSTPGVASTASQEQS